MALTAKRRQKLLDLAFEIPSARDSWRTPRRDAPHWLGLDCGPIYEAVNRARENGESLSAIHLRHVHPLPNGLEAISREIQTHPCRGNERPGALRMRPARQHPAQPATAIQRSPASPKPTDSPSACAKSSTEPSNEHTRPTPHIPRTGKLTKKFFLTADHPTVVPGCGDFAVLASFYKMLEKRQLPHGIIVTLAGIGCSSRFPYFVNTHGAHFIHGRRCRSPRA